MQQIEITENVLLIRINRLYHEHMTEEELYEVTRGIWKIGIRREKADYVFSVYKGQVEEVYEIKFMPIQMLHTVPFFGNLITNTADILGEIVPI